MPQLDPTWYVSQIFWLLISFGFLYLVIARVVLPPLMGVMATRSQKIHTDLQQAQELKAQAEDARLAYERTLAEARARSQQLIDDAMANHKQRTEQAMRQLEGDIGLKISDAQKRIADRKAQLIEQLVPTAAELSTLIVQKVAQKSVAPDRVSAIIHQLSKAQGNG